MFSFLRTTSKLIPVNLVICRIANPSCFNFLIKLSLFQYTIISIIVKHFMSLCTICVILINGNLCILTLLISIFTFEATRKSGELYPRRFSYNYFAIFITTLTVSTQFGSWMVYAPSPSYVAVTEISVASRYTLRHGQQYNPDHVRDNIAVTEQARILYLCRSISAS